MKNSFYLFVAVTLIALSFSSCEKQDENTGIPGMGDTPGKIEIKEPFIAPQGMTISVFGADEITADELLNNNMAQLKSTSDDEDIETYGAGGSYYNNNFRFWIRIKLKVTNETNEDKDLLLKAGLIFEVQEEGYQHGLIVEDIHVPIRARCEKEFYVMAFCLNRGKDGSHADVHYKIIGTVANMNICSIISYINSFNGLNLENFSKPSMWDLLLNMYDIIQNAIWSVTNDLEDGLTDEQKAELQELWDSITG